MTLDDLKVFANRQGFSAIARSQVHWQVIDRDGTPLIDIWPTTAKWRSARAKKGVKASRLMHDAEIYEAIDRLSDLADDMPQRPSSEQLIQDLLLSDRLLEETGVNH